MLGDAVTALIREEYAREGAAFIAADIDAYLARLDERAEIVADTGAGRCRGVVAFYCNDMATKIAYITLVLVDPRDRGQGLARTLVRRALDVAKGRGFTSCGLEVSRSNEAATALYTSLGFRVVETRERTDLMAIAL